MVIFAICREPVEVTARFAAQNSITFPILSDPGGQLIRRVGILNAEVAPDDPVYGIPYPGSYLVDELGMVFEKRFHADFHVREPMGSLLLYFQLKEYSEHLEQKVEERSAQLVEAARLATLGKLIAAINHELNSPLGALTSGIDVLGRYFDRTSQQAPARERAVLEETRQTVDAACRRIIQVVADLRQFIRLDQAEVQAIDLRQSLDSVLALVSSRLDGRITIERHYQEIPLLECRPAQIHQALFEVLTNALESIESAGSIALSAGMEAGQILLTIRDTGRGIPADQMEALFEPRLRPKNGRMGVSLGLMLAQKIVLEHRGSLRISSVAGLGATVSIRLPVHPRSGG